MNHFFARRIKLDKKSIQFRLLLFALIGSKYCETIKRTIHWGEEQIIKYKLKNLNDEILNSEEINNVIDTAIFEVEDTDIENNYENHSFFINMIYVQRHVSECNYRQQSCYTTLTVLTFLL